MKRKFYLPLILILFVTISCNKTVEHKECRNQNEYLVQSVLWYQQSAEMKALYYQAYNTARMMLDIYLKDSKTKKKKAVIVDIDETILNNVKYEAWLIQNNSQQSKSGWKQWTDKADADTLPGALDFLNYAKTRAVEVFYVSNRTTDDVAASLKNLKKFNFPFADEHHMLFKSDKSSSKESRRKAIEKDYDIVLLCGDNLGDFSAAFDDRTEKLLTDSISSYKSLFGKRFIVFPNPMYGAWEKQIYGKGDFTAKQKDSIRKACLKGY